MADDARDTDVVEVTRTTVVETTETVAAEPAIDWDAAPAETVIVETGAPVAVAYVAPPSARGRWDFTSRQRVILAILIWLNILMFVVGYLAVTGHIAL